MINKRLFSFLALVTVLSNMNFSLLKADEVKVSQKRTLKKRVASILGVVGVCSAAALCWLCRSDIKLYLKSEELVSFNCKTLGELQHYKVKKVSPLEGEKYRFKIGPVDNFDGAVHTDDLVFYQDDSRKPYFHDGQIDLDKIGSRCHYENEFDYRWGKWTDLSLNRDAFLASSFAKKSDIAKELN